MSLPKGFPCCVICGKPALKGICSACSHDWSGVIPLECRNEISKMRLGLIV